MLHACYFLLRGTWPDFFVLPVRVLDGATGHASMQAVLLKPFFRVGFFNQGLQILVAAPERDLFEVVETTRMVRVYAPPDLFYQSLVVPCSMLKRHLVHMLMVGGLIFRFGTSVAQTVLTPHAIIAAYIQAMGGSARIQATKSLDIHGAISLMGQTAPMHEILMNEKGFRNDMVFNGIRIVQCITDTGGWEINPMAGHAKPVAMSRDAWSLEKGSLDIGGPLHEYARKGSMVTLNGLVSLNHSGAYELRLLDQNGICSVYYIDTASHLLVRNVITRLIRGVSHTITIDFSDYTRLSNGLMWPLRTVTVLPQGYQMVATDSSVVVNGPLPDHVFAMPNS